MYYPSKSFQFFVMKIFLINRHMILSAVFIRNVADDRMNLFLLYKKESELSMYGFYLMVYTNRCFLFFSCFTL